ncbi:hypothetical protein D3C77_544300 [compost metagenome]
MRRLTYTMRAAREFSTRVSRQLEYMLSAEPRGDLSKRCLAQQLSEKQSQTDLGARARNVEEIPIAFEFFTPVRRWPRLKPLKHFSEIILVPASAQHNDHVFELSSLYPVFCRERRMPIDELVQRYQLRVRNFP